MEMEHWDERTTIDIKNENIEGLAIEIFISFLIITGAGLIIGAWIWL